MMGGLQSIVQIGFALIALARFSGQFWEMIKKFSAFILKTNKKVVAFLLKLLPSRQVKQLITIGQRPESKNKDFNLMLAIVRVFAVLSNYQII